MRSVTVVQVDNATPIVLNLDKFVIRGTHGVVDLSRCTRTKGGHPVCRCGFDDQRNDRSLEVPAWMFEAAACDHLRVVDTPFVDSQALIELKAVLQTASRADVLQAQHPCLTVPLKRI